MFPTNTWFISLQHCLQRADTIFTLHPGINYGLIVKLGSIISLSSLTLQQN